MADIVADAVANAVADAWICLPRVRSTIPKDDPDLLKNRPVRDRFLVAVAGVAANFVFALAILTAQARCPSLAAASSTPSPLSPTAALPALCRRDGVAMTAQ